MNCNNCANYKPKRAPSGDCLNSGCVSQHDGKCFDDGSHFDPDRCTSRVTPKPAPSIEAQLREAGAKRIASDNASIRDHGTMTAWVRYDGKVDLLVGDLTPARAVAALRAATNKHEPCPSCVQLLKLQGDDAKQLAAANAEIARLKAEIAEAHGIIFNMKEGHDNTYDSHGCHVCAWLTRNGGA